jgi:hypothetical protein
MHDSFFDSTSDDCDLTIKKDFREFVCSFISEKESCSNKIIKITNVVTHHGIEKRRLYGIFSIFCAFGM